VRSLLRIRIFEAFDSMTHSEIIDLLARPTISVEEAGGILELSRNSAYRAARSGELPAIKIGRIVRIPTAKLCEMLGLPLAVGSEISRAGETNAR
jgi:excisionase family DNA binding protein